MNDVYMSQGTGRKVVRLVLVFFVLFLVVIGYVWSQAYIGCERAKLDRKSAIKGWRTAETARIRTLAEDMDVPVSTVKLMMKKPQKPSDPADLVAARRYHLIASDLAVRSDVVCGFSFSKESVQ